jgi:Cellulose binding domain/Polysaccharide lyase family 4, domain II/Polysaccharide lyase family 4, domain III
MSICRMSYIVAALLLFCALQRVEAQITINTSNATDWKIANGAISMDWDSTAGDVWSMFLTGFSTDLVDKTHCCTHGHPSGLYMDNTGTGFTGITQAPSGVTPTASFSLVAGSYLDWWIAWAPTSSSPWGMEQHFIVQPNDPTLYAYTVLTHQASSGAATFGQLQYVYRINQTEFNNTYQVNSGLNNLGPTSIKLPSVADMSSTDPGRAVQNAVEDLHGFSLPSGFGREFYTKYDYSAYEYLLQVNGNYGPHFGAWSIIPSNEYMAGGPTKQVEVYTGNILMGELFSGHLANAISYNEPAGANTKRPWGPIGFHFNALNSSHDTVAALYQDAVNTIPTAQALFDKDAVLASHGYVPHGAGRGTLVADITGGGSESANTAWTVLSDQFTNMQYSTRGAQYWGSNNANGSLTLHNVTPGTYRLSSYVLGEWGQLREDDVTISAGGTTTATLTFSPENFSANAPIWTIGTADRSSHEFLHGENNYGSTGSCAGCDDREYQGNWNYWLDFESTHGAPVYYATAVGSTPATNDLLKWNYVQWREFDPGLYAGIHNSSDDTTDGYKYILPPYVSSVTATVPAWQVHFATTTRQNAQGSFVDLSVGLAATESDLTASLNGHSITWHAKNKSDADVRSGLSGYYQWMVFEWPTSDLVAAGGDNDLTLSVSGGGGNMYDALRMEISAKGANPSTTGWRDYEYLSSTGTDTPENPAVSNNNTGTVVQGQNPSFTLSSSASSLSVAEGATATGNIVITDVGGFNGSVELSASSLPNGVTASFGNNPTSGSSALTLTASNSAGTGTFVVTVTGTSGSLAETTSISLTVTGRGSTPSFTLSRSAAALSVTQGSGATDTITVTDQGGFTGSVTLAASGLPSGVTAAFSTNPAIATSVLTFTVASTTVAGTYPITITGHSGTLTPVTTTIALTATGKGTCTIDYVISPQNSSGFGAALTINNGGAALSDWTLTWTFANGQTVAELWNGIATQSGANVTVKNEPYNGSIAAGGSLSGIGFNGTWSGVANPVPASFSLNGTACARVTSTKAPLRT